MTTEENIQENEISERFSQFYSKSSKAKYYIVSVFVLSIFLQGIQFYITKGLSLVDYLIMNPKYEFFLVTLSLFSLILLVGSMFSFLFVFITSETEKYYRIAEENCIKFSKENQNGKLVRDKMDEEIKWVRDNICKAP